MGDPLSPPPRPELKAVAQHTGGCGWDKKGGYSWLEPKWHRQVEFLDHPSCYQGKTVGYSLYSLTPQVNKTAVKYTNPSSCFFGLWAVRQSRVSLRSIWILDAKPAADSRGGVPPPSECLENFGTFPSPEYNSGWGTLFPTLLRRGPHPLAAGRRQTRARGRRMDWTAKR